MHSQSENIDPGVITRRTAFLGLGVVGCYGILASRLYYLQVTKAEDYRTLSDNNRFNFNITLPSRGKILDRYGDCLLYTSPSPRDATLSRMPSSA